MVGVITRNAGLGEPHRHPPEADEPILPPNGTGSPQGDPTVPDHFINGRLPEP